MSEPTPPTLDYGHPETHVNVVGTFVLHAVIWAIISCFFLCVGVMAGAGMGGSVIAGVVGCVLALFGLAVWAVRVGRRADNPRRRSAQVSGSLAGVAVGLLLVGGCFAVLNGWSM